MKNIKIYLFVLLLSVAHTISAEVRDLDTQKNKEFGILTGHVLDEKGEHLPFVNISIEGTILGTVTDHDGHFMLKGIPAEEVNVKVQYIGYKTQVQSVKIVKGEKTDVHFTLEEDLLGLDEVVVTADRTVKNRREASTIVNTLTPQIFEFTQSTTFGEGLNFTPGLRMEDNCQNCGFSQVRMNGMEGPYSQILINSRPIFSGLAGVYGLELIPFNMIDRIEVMRGGGSALYGSNAIAGTINMILKDPISNSYEIGSSSSWTGYGLKDRGNIAPDNSISMNTSLISRDNKTGLALYGFWRDREPFDANNDNFSEIAKLENTTFGGRFFQRLGVRNKISVDFFNIREDRRGGDSFDKLNHEANTSEALQHKITTGAVTYDQFFRTNDMWSVYVSGQYVDRNSYYGAEKSLKDYGKTTDFTYTLGTQYLASFENSSNLTVGIENISSNLNDQKLGYADFENATMTNGEWVIPHTENTLVADQESNTLGVFAQYEKTFNKFSASLGARYDHYKISDKTHKGNDKDGNVFSPRITLKYDILSELQARVSYSQGYRAPQVFDEDLHIETSGAKQIIHKNDVNLKQEKSYSYMASLDYNKRIGDTYVNFLIEGFYTKLDDAFANKFSDPDAEGVVVYTRVNAEGGAKISGVNMEMNIIPSEKLAFKGGFTVQNSKYEQEQDFNEKKFFRTPDNYGYLMINWTPVEDFSIATSANYTGSMLVPYNEKVLRKSDSFTDVGVKFSYDIKLTSNSKLRLFTGMKNIFNSYQDDFDKGIDRDPAYIYGPMNPRTIYFGIKIGNNLR